MRRGALILALAAALSAPAGTAQALHIGYDGDHERDGPLPGYTDTASGWHDSDGYEGGGDGHHALRISDGGFSDGTYDGHHRHAARVPGAPTILVLGLGLAGLLLARRFSRA